MAASRIEGRLWLLQERLKQERLFVTKEKECIRLLNTEVQVTCEKLFHASWIAGQQWRNLQRLQAHPAKASYANKLLDSAEFVDAYKSLGYLESKYGDFLKKLRENPQLLASSLAFVDEIKINIDTKQVSRLLLNSLYGNCLLPEDENYVLVLMRSLMEYQIIKSEQPQKFFRSPRNWSFTVIFVVLIESLFSAKLYLTAALHTPILHVLARDSKIQAQLPYLCTRFVQSLQEKLYCFPPSLRWLICQLYNVLKSSGTLTINEVKCMVSELLFNYLVCPAIINPEPYGINSDMQVSKIARINLQQISSLLCKRCTSPWEGSGGHSDDLFNTVDVKCISSFVDSILEGAGHVSNFPEQQTLLGLCRTSVLITENELNSLICYLRMIHSWQGDVQFPHRQELGELLNLLPPDKESSNYSSKPIISASPLASPKVHHKKNPFSKTKSKNRFNEDDVKVEKSAMSALASITPQVSKSQRYHQECVKRLGELYEENKPVLVVPLGYSVVESPGMLPEEKVLGVEKKKQRTKKAPERSLSDSGSSMRQRSNSQRFTKLFHNLSIEKDLNTRDSGNSVMGSSSSHNQLETIVGSPPQLHDAEPPQQPSLGGMQDVDILSHNPFESHQPDVVDIPSQPVNSTNDQIDLLSFDNDIPAVPSLVPLPHQPNPISLLDAPLLDLNSPPSSTRDSTISTGSSARTSTLSSLSSGTRESAIDSGFHDIEEHFNTIGENNEFRPRTSVLIQESTANQNIDNEHDGFAHNRYSSSSSTIVNEQTTHRQSQISFDDSTKTGSSSSSDEGSDQESQERSTIKKSNSLKSAGHKMKSKTLRLKEKIKKRKGVDRPKSMPETDLRPRAEKSGLFKRNKRVRQKQSGARTYQEIDENLDYFAITPDIPKEQVVAAGEKTPKDIVDSLIFKYSEMAASMALEDTQEDDSEQTPSDEEDEEDIDEETRFDDTKRKLRLVLNQADFRNLPWLVSKDRIISISPLKKSAVGDLMTFLHVQLAEAINLQNRSLAAQLHETIRSVKQLSQDSCSKILDSIESEYQARMPYLAYLTRSRQTLLTTESHLERLIERVQKNQMLCQKCFNTNCITLFLEVREGRINSFITDFRSPEKCPTVDEKCKLLELFLDELSDDLAKDDTWLGATEEQLQEGNISIERDIMARIYNDAFYPNGQIDMERDKAFTEHVKSLQKVVGITHKAIRIPKLYRKEAPWPSAQQELSTINAYKTPKDKLKCVQRCCFTIMNLLNMACTTNGCEPAGADEFVPALVCVLIHSNPPSLLSTMQYVSNFYGQRLSGEEAWSWMQLCAAIEYTKTIRV